MISPNLTNIAQKSLNTLKQVAAKIQNAIECKDKLSGFPKFNHNDFDYFNDCPCIHTKAAFHKVTEPNNYGICDLYFVKKDNAIFLLTPIWLGQSLKTFPVFPQQGNNQDSVPIGDNMTYFGCDGEGLLFLAHWPKGLNQGKLFRKEQSNVFDECFNQIKSGQTTTNQMTQMNKNVNPLQVNPVQPKQVDEISVIARHNLNDLGPIIITISPLATGKELKEAIKRKMSDCVKFVFNGREIEDNKTLSALGMKDSSSVIVERKQKAQTMPQPINVNNNASNVSKINIVVNYNGVTQTFATLDSNTPISELINMIHERVNNKNVEVIYNAKKLEVNDNGQLFQIFGKQNSVVVMVNDKQNVVQTSQNQNILKFNFNNGLSSSGAAIVNQPPVPVQVPTKPPVVSPQVGPMTAPPRPLVVPKVVPVQVPVKRQVVRPVQPPVVSPSPVVLVPKLVPVKTFRPLQVVNNNPFGDQTTKTTFGGRTTTFNGQTTGYGLGLQTFKGLKTGQPSIVRPPTVVPVQVPTQPPFAPAPVVPKLVPVKTVVGQPPKFVPQPVTVPVPPRPLFVPKVVPKLPMRPTVGPVPQSGDGRPEPNTLYKAVSFNPLMDATRWEPMRTLKTPNNQTYQQFIDYQIRTDLQNIANYNENFQPKYRYVDEFGLAFTSDRPIFKDARNNLVTLGNATYGLP